MTVWHFSVVSHSIKSVNSKNLIFFSLLFYLFVFTLPLFSSLLFSLFSRFPFSLFFFPLSLLSRPLFSSLFFSCFLLRKYETSFLFSVFLPFYNENAIPLFFYSHFAFLFTVFPFLFITKMQENRRPGLSSPFFYSFLQRKYKTFFLLLFFPFFL